MRTARSGFGIVLLSACIAMAAAPARAAAMPPDEATTAFAAAFAEQKRGNLEGVLPALDPIIAALEEKQAKQPTFCAETPQQTLATVAEFLKSRPAPEPGQPAGKASIVEHVFCAALFLKGFVLIDLGRPAEAEAFLRRAHEAEPTNAHFLNEYAEWYKMSGQWQRAHDLFAEAVQKADLAADDVKGPFKARALRGLGYTEIELGKLDEAEAHMRESQRHDPANPAAARELEYIARLRRHDKT